MPAAAWWQLLPINYAVSHTLSLRKGNSPYLTDEKTEVQKTW